MKAVILAGGLGTRLSEETVLKPKPMVEIGGRPILWHIMKIYAHQGVKEFIVALGYKGEVVKEYFLNFYAMHNNLSINLADGEATIHDNRHIDWKVHLVDTGPLTQTGGRLKRLEKWLADDETFFFTYGDGVADIDLPNLLAFHRSHGKLATLTSVRSPERFGRIHYEGELITDFFEKPETSEGWINGGYFVLNRGVFDYIKGDGDIWERGPLEALVRDGQLAGYQHPSFWSCMDTLREKHHLEQLWNHDQAPWKLWN